MIIEENDYKIESVGTYKPYWFWDLYLSKTVNKGKENERSEFKLEGYGFTTDAVIERILNNRDSYNQEEVLKMKEYFKTFEDVRTEKIIFPKEYYSAGLQIKRSKKKRTSKKKSNETQE